MPEENLRLILELDEEYALKEYDNCGFFTGYKFRTEEDVVRLKQLVRQELIRRGLEA
ncbi:MAG TPA: hypothetical protein VF553_07020 [Pyrinomonadaceae bacterium]|jgi:hypothetical protein